MPKSYSERGFAQYAKTLDSDRRTEVSVYESSSAEGAFVWLGLQGEALLDKSPRPFPGIPAGFAEGHLGAHLSVDQARIVRDGLDEFIREHTDHG